MGTGVEELKALLGKATPGPWEADSEKDEHGMRFATMHAGAAPYYALFDSMNADYRVVSCERDYDEDGGADVWDETARRNFALIVAAVNTLPAFLELVDAAEQALRYIEGDETAHGRSFGAGNALRDALSKISTQPAA
jgi:hypothetical protein